VVFVMDAMAMPSWLISKSQRALLAHCAVERPDAWRIGLPRVLIRNFLNRGGVVLIVIGEKRGLLRLGEPAMWGSEDQVMDFFGAANVLTGDFGLPKPTFDADELFGQRQ
jgi:hypothetical protein